MLPDLLRAVVRDHAGTDKTETDRIWAGHMKSGLCEAGRPVANAFALSPKRAYFPSLVLPFRGFFWRWLENPDDLGGAGTRGLSR
jgi:hypothetical protein